MYSVCGHIETRREDGGAQDPRHCLLGVKETWMPKNTECRAGWCPTCSEHWRQHQLESVKEEVIKAYWHYLARHKWTKPVDPGRVRRSALRKGGTTTTSSEQWPAHAAVAACLFSLRLDVKRSRSMTLTAAKIIRNGTLAWASRLEAEARARVQQTYSEELCGKPFPLTPNLRKPSWEYPSSSRQEDAHVSVLEHLHSAIDHVLQDLQWTSDEESPITETTWTPSSWAEPNDSYYPYHSEDAHHAVVISSSSSPGPGTGSGSGSGSFRTPSHRTPSPPPRPSRSMARCHRHGHIPTASARVDMRCDTCAGISLHESTVPVGSPLGHRSCDVAFLQQSGREQAAVHTRACYCYEGPFPGVLTCDSCLAREDFALRTGVDWI